MSERTVNGLTRDQFVWMLDDITSDDADYGKVMAWFDGIAVMPDPAGVVEAVAQAASAHFAHDRIDLAAMLGRRPTQDEADAHVLKGYRLASAFWQALAVYDASRAAQAAPEEGERES